MRLAVCLAAAMVAIGCALLPGVQLVEHRFYDLRARQLARSTQPSDEIVVVALDDASLQRLEPELGRWPWPRALFAEVLQVLTPARTVLIDILFSEPDLRDPAGDNALVEAVRQHDGVILAAYLTLEEEPPADRLARATGAVAPFEALAGAATAMGHVNYLADRDGVTRDQLTAIAMDGTVYPSMALAGIRHFTGDGLFQPGTQTDGRLPLLQSQKSHRVVPIADVVAAARGNAPSALADLFKDRMVLIGSLATGLEDDRQVTPLSVYTAGVSVMATAADNLLQDQYVRIPAGWVAPLMILFLALVPALARPDRPLALVTLALSAGGMLALFAAMALRTRLMLPLVGPGLGLVLSCSGLGVAHWIGERNRRRTLEALDRAKQQFTDMLVHDLRNQSAPIVAALSLLEKRVGDADEKGLCLVRSAQSGARRLVSRVSCLLDIRKMSEGKLTLDLATVALRPLVDDVAQGLRVSAERAGVEVLVHGEASARADEDVLRRVVENLLLNAIQHATLGTTIEMACREGSAGEVMLVVGNSGQVIPPAGLQDMIHPFVSGARAQGRGVRLHGTGLGLAFCDVAVRAHGGTIRFESPRKKSGDGVDVLVSLPAATG